MATRVSLEQTTTPIDLGGHLSDPFHSASFSESSNSIFRPLAPLTPSPPSFAERMLSFIEGPWAPAKEDLPVKRNPEDAGNSSEPFRSLFSSPEAKLRATKNVQAINASCTRTKLTPWTSIYEYTVTLRPEHVHLSGMRILHLSDIHLLEGHTQPSDELHAIASYIKDLPQRIDVSVVTGDLITKTPRDMRRKDLDNLALIADHSQYGFFVPGNHDYHGHNLHYVTSQVEATGFKDLNNSVAQLRRRGCAINVCGVDDAYFGFPLAPQHLDESTFNLVLTHNLDSIRSNFPTAVDLILSGHTHWGECCFFNGAQLMNLWGYSDNVNSHTQGWDHLTDRTLSFVHPGLARYYVPYRGLRHPPGFVLINLTEKKVDT